MKRTFLCLATLSLLTTTIYAQTPAPSPEPALSSGKYLLITAEKGNISVEDCEMVADKDGTTIRFAAPTKYPEAALKPIPLFRLVNGAVEFYIGPGDQVNTPILKRMGAGASVYIGSFSEGELRGRFTRVDGSDDPHTGTFALHKL